MEATVAKVRDFVRKRIGGQRVWRVGVAMSATTIRVTLLTPDKPERLTEERDKGRAPIIEGLEREIKRAFGREVVIDVVQSPCAVARYIRISPRKCRFVVDAIRNKPVQDALAILQFVPNSAAQTVSKLLKSAVANAENNHRMDAETLEVIHVHVDEGPSLKRISPRAMGRAYRILKRTSHITIGLGETEKAPKVAGRGKGIARTVEKAPRKAAAGRARAAKESTASAAVSGKGGETETKRRRERGGGK